MRIHEDIIISAESLQASADAMVGDFEISKRIHTDHTASCFKIMLRSDPEEALLPRSLTAQMFPVTALLVPATSGSVALPVPPSTDGSENAPSDTDSSRRETRVGTPPTKSTPQLDLLRLRPRFLLRAAFAHCRGISQDRDSQSQKPGSQMPTSCGIQVLECARELLCKISVRSTSFCTRELQWLKHTTCAVSRVVGAMQNGSSVARNGAYFIHVSYRIEADVLGEHEATVPAVLLVVDPHGAVPNVCGAWEGGRVEERVVARVEDEERRLGRPHERGARRAA